MIAQRKYKLPISWKLFDPAVVSGNAGYVTLTLAANKGQIIAFYNLGFGLGPFIMPDQDAIMRDLDSAITNAHAETGTYPARVYARTGPEGLVLPEWLVEKWRASGVEFRTIERALFMEETV